MNLGSNLKFLREKNKLNQTEVANIIGIERITYNHYETQEKIIPLMRLNDLANYYDVSIDFIFNFTYSKNYADSKKSIDAYTFGQNFKIWRKNNKLTQAKIANIINVDSTVVTNWENGKHLIATAFLYDICKKYKISADYLLGKIDEPKYLK